MLSRAFGAMLRRPLTAVFLALALGPALGACSPFSAYVADRWPHWAGGLPADAPPRPGTPGYDEFIAHGQAARQGQAQTSAQTGTVAVGAPNAQPAAAPTAPATIAAAPAPPAVPAMRAEPVAPPSEEPGDANVTRGGLY